MIRALIGIVVVCFLGSCGNDSSTNPADTFDRSAMLTSMADSMIVPGYAACASRLADFEQACSALVADPTPARVVTARSMWFRLQYAWSVVQQFDFGPAESATGNLSVSIGTFPTNAAKLESYVAANDTSFANYDRDTRGIYGAEYMLFGPTGDSAVVASAFAADPARGAYLRAIVRDLAARITPVVQAWKGSYRAAFIANNGTAIGSSTSLVFNEFNKSYENIKNYKWSVPLGLRPGQPGPEPTKVECYYASMPYGHDDESLNGTRAHFTSIVRTWQYFKPYLEVVPGGPDLIVQTQAQIDTVSHLLATFPASPSLSQQVVASPAAAMAVFTELQKLTRFFKSEMSSRLGIAITYASGDGD